MNLVLMLVMLTVPATETVDIEPYPYSTWFESFSTPQPVKVEGNPLNFCGARIGLDVRGIELPRGWEGGYRFAARFPIIDYVSNRPLYMKHWAEEQGEYIIYLHQDPMIAVGCCAEILTGQQRIDFPGLNEFKEGAFPTQSREFRDKLTESGFSEDYCNILVDFYLLFSYSGYINRKATDGLSTEDLDFLIANPGYYVSTDNERMPSLTGSTETHLEFIERARKVKMENVFEGENSLSGAVYHYVCRTNGMREEDFFNLESDKTEVFRFNSPYGLIIIAGFGPDTVAEDAAVIINLGGDDVYTGSAGAAINGVSAVIDHEGNDIYDAGEEPYAQGFGFLGTGLLVDLAGNDTYMAKHFAQGAGILGVGAIWDARGNDSYDAHAFCQGAGAFGLGMILDDEGDDFYDCATLGQGAATTMGLGILSDLTGDDTFQLAVTKGKDNLHQSPGYGQGGALSFRHYPWYDKLTPYGGVGMLVNAEGDDRYHSKGWCDQGGSYIMSLGVLYEAEGNDHYTAGTGQGSGIHITNAILVDKRGNDTYEGGFRSGGSGGDRSPGFLLDYEGDDTYRAGRACYGTGVKPFSYSLMIDYLGEDTYIAGNPADKITFNNWESFGGVWPESEPNLWPWAIFMDLNGEDDYQVRFRTNDSEYCSFGHGIALDVDREDLDWHGNDVIGEVERPLQSYVDFELPRKVKKSDCYEDIKLLQSPDLFTRFQVTGRIVEKGPDVIPALVDALMASRHRQFNRDCMECIHYFFVNGKVTDKHASDLIRLLDAPDPEVRTLIADNFGIWKIESAEKALVKALEDDEPSVRRFALRSLTAIESKKGLKKMKGLAADDPSEDVRRTAIYCLIRVSEEDIYPLLADRIRNDEASSVRIAGIDGIRHLQMKEGANLLYEVSKESDVYVKRAAGKAMAEMYRIEGIRILIESLSFPSIDAFDNYNRNVPNYIAAYAGHDLGEERYEQKAWQEWFDENENSIDIRYNVDSYREFTQLSRELSDMDNEAQIDGLEDFLSRYPDHAQAARTLASTLNRIAWFLVTDAKGTSQFDPRRAVEYADRAVQLDPQANYVDTQAEAYFASGDLDKAEEICIKALEQWPQNPMFTERRKRIEVLRKED